MHEWITVISLKVSLGTIQPKLFFLLQMIICKILNTKNGHRKWPKWCFPCWTSLHGRAGIRLLFTCEQIFNSSLVSSASICRVGRFHCTLVLSSLCTCHVLITCWKISCSGYRLVAVTEYKQLIICHICHLTYDIIYTYLFKYPNFF